MRIINRKGNTTLILVERAYDNLEIQFEMIVPNLGEGQRKQTYLTIIVTDNDNKAYMMLTLEQSKAIRDVLNQYIVELEDTVE